MIKSYLVFIFFQNSCSQYNNAQMLLLIDNNSFWANLFQFCVIMQQRTWKTKFNTSHMLILLVEKSVSKHPRLMKGLNPPFTKTQTKHISIPTLHKAFVIYCGSSEDETYFSIQTPHSSLRVFIPFRKLLHSLSPLWDRANKWCTWWIVVSTSIVDHYNQFP